MVKSDFETKAMEKWKGQREANAKPDLPEIKHPFRTFNCSPSGK
jgi:hypothetical protein